MSLSLVSKAKKKNISRTPPKVAKPRRRIMAPKKKSSKPAAKNADTVPDSDHIVFAKDGAKEKKKPAAGADAQDAPPKPDARKIIGGVGASRSLHHVYALSLSSQNPLFKFRQSIDPIILSL